MRYLLIAGLMCAMAAPLAMARAIPDPNQKHAPGNEEPQKPISQAGYSTPVNYQLQCAGCHLGDGTGSKANDTPKMKGFVGNFLKVEGGREFLVRVPGMSQSALNNAQLADLINWMMRKDGIAGSSVPDDYKPYTEAEVAKIRSVTLLNLPDTRAGLIRQMREKGITIDDGMDNAY
ncbi:cytochrome C [Pseudomonas sp. JS3066]|uniref:cytochrome C n=1 Tax=unclassified Pseudomonas TaxID=196821 RepID=UPI00129E87D5|nr:MULTISPECIES: cytochrome C [unclassified Pseudomonas]MRK23748.1 cytochrome C [Pseudomonas sp. JG-B]WVK96133.1 cytochrome C [Pseudomonas sp. JS3066]